jgi:hypothetical protein
MWQIEVNGVQVFITNGVKAIELRDGFLAKREEAAARIAELLNRYGGKRL